jgi:hypothetical protein
MIEKAFSDGTVAAESPSAHAGFQIVLSKEQLPLAAGEMPSLLGMDHHLILSFVPPRFGGGGASKNDAWLIE